MGEGSKDVFWTRAIGYGCSLWNLFNFCHRYNEGNRQALLKSDTPNQDVLINQEFVGGASRNIHLNCSKTNLDEIHCPLSIPVVILTDQPKSTYDRLENYAKGANHESRTYALHNKKIKKCLALSHQLSDNDSISLDMPQVDDLNLVIEDNNGEYLVRNGQYFLVLINSQQQELEKCCIVAQSHLGDISRDPSLEEAEGIVRSAIGKANLLMGNKFCQFRELCQMNIDPNPLQKQITDQDLMGFWDMVQIQVDDLKKAFTEIEQLRMNGWQCQKKGLIQLPSSRKVPVFKQRKPLSIKTTGQQRIRQNASKDVPTNVP